MAQFSADIALKLNSTAAERGIRKVERNLNKIESTTKDILGVDKQIIRERRALVRISGEQATKAKRRIKDLSLQKAELSLQKRELQQINRLEKQRTANANRARGASAPRLSWIRGTHQRIDGSPRKTNRSVRCAAPWTEYCCWNQSSSPTQPIGAAAVHCCRITPADLSKKKASGFLRA